MWHWSAEILGKTTLIVDSHLFALQHNRIPHLMHSAAAAWMLPHRWHMDWEYVAERCSSSTPGEAGAKIPPLSVGERQRGTQDVSSITKPCQEKEAWVNCGLLPWLDAQKDWEFAGIKHLLVFSTRSHGPICNLGVTGSNWWQIRSQVHLVWVPCVAH